MPITKISPLLFCKPTANEIIEHVKAGTVTGFLVVDIEPTPAAQKYERINWPPIFMRDEIQFENLPEWLQNGTNSTSFPRKTLIQTMHAEKVLLHTALLKFYLANGFVVKQLYKFVEFQPSKCFKEFHDKLYRLRVEATIEKNEAKASAIKLTGNSTYGKVSLSCV